jgi:hypothetical protein
MINLVYVALGIARPSRHRAMTNYEKLMNVLPACDRHAPWAAQRCHLADMPNTNWLIFVVSSGHRRRRRARAPSQLTLVNMCFMRRRFGVQHP